MDLIKIGNFIAKCRKAVNLTQMQLAEKLNITDRAVSKWETGRALPDSSIMLELCAILKINVNELLSGESLNMENYDKELEKNLIEMAKQKEKADKMLLKLEFAVGISCVIVLLALTLIVSLVQMEEWLRVVLVFVGLIPLIVALPFLIKIEQTAGYYKCKHCGNKYIPSYTSVFMAMHMGRTRYLKCPKCNKYSWQKKVLNKN